jgi:hypothetical protein
MFLMKKEEAEAIAKYCWHYSTLYFVCQNCGRHSWSQLDNPRAKTKLCVTCSILSGNKMQGEKHE